jgi:pilus assembly protein Flp/PilA
LFCLWLQPCGTNTRDRAGNAQPVIFINPEGSIQMRKLVTRFAKNEEGAALVEYGMLVGLIAVACVVAVGTLGATISGYFDNINTNL